MKKMLGVVLSALVVTGLSLPPAEAHNRTQCWTDYHGRRHCDSGLHKGWNKHHDRDALLDWKTRSVIRGGLVGAAAGAGAGILLDRPVGKTAAVGATIGASRNAIKNSNYMNRHPIVKTAAYGALVGAGASQLSREGDVKKGVLWGGLIGGGLGAAQNLDD